MFSLFSNRPQDTYNIVLDIQSGLVRGALFFLDPSTGVSHVLKVVTNTYSRRSTIVNSEHLTKKHLKLIEEVIKSLIIEAPSHRIGAIHYLLSSPWIFSLLKTVKVDYAKETEITTGILREIVQKETKNTTAFPDAVAIEQKIFEVRLNGYGTAIYEGKKANKLEVSLCTSFGSQVFLRRVHDLVSKHVHVKSYSYHSALLMQYMTLRDVLKQSSEFIHMHVHSELTDVIMVKDGLCKHIASFPYGIQTFLRRLATATQTTIEASDSALSLYQGNKLSEEEKTKMQATIVDCTQKWTELFLTSFTDVFNSITIPRTIYLSAHSHFDLFKEALMYQNNISFDIISHDTIETPTEIVFEKGVAHSTMIQIYVYALENMV